MSWWNLKLVQESLRWQTDGQTHPQMDTAENISPRNATLRGISISNLSQLEFFNGWISCLVVLAYNSVYYYNGAQKKQFLQVGRLYRALILLGLALFQVPLCLRSSWCYIDIKFFCIHPSLYLLVSWAWWDWPLTWLTNHRPSVLTLLVGSCNP